MSDPTSVTRCSIHYRGPWPNWHSLNFIGVRLDWLSYFCL